MKFTFKQFAVKQERSAMKIGTDGVLLGTWTSIDNQPLSILDIGAGTGIISLLLAQRSLSKTIDAIELDENAYEECVDNFEASDWGDRLFCYHSSAQQFAEEVDDKYDLIVSNPPYVSYDDYNKIHERVKKYEPNNAIFVNDNDLLIFYKIIIKKASISLRKNGLIFFECNEKNIEDVFNVLKDHRFKNIDIKKDFRNKKRMIKAQK